MTRNQCYPLLLPFLFSCHWIVQFCTIQRQLKRNEGSTLQQPRQKIQFYALGLSVVDLALNQ
jgi:hypothetical protein